MSKVSQRAIKQHLEVLDARIKRDQNIRNAAFEMYEALTFIKAWFQHLEDGCDDDDPLKVIRKRVHAPIHAEIDRALAKADGAA